MLCSFDKPFILIVKIFFLKRTILPSVPLHILISIWHVACYKGINDMLKNCFFFIIGHFVRGKNNTYQEIQSQPYIVIIKFSQTLQYPSINQNTVLMVNMQKFLHMIVFYLLGTKRILRIFPIFCCWTWGENTGESIILRTIVHYYKSRWLRCIQQKTYFSKLRKNRRNGWIWLVRVHYDFTRCKILKHMCAGALDCGKSTARYGITITRLITCHS